RLGGAAALPGTCRNSRMALTTTISTDASCASIPAAMVTPPASTPASSSPTVTSAMAMFCRITPTVRRAMAMACGNFIRSSCSSAMSAVSLATADPMAPTATPAAAARQPAGEPQPDGDQRYGDVLPHHANGATCDGDGVWQLHQVVVQQRDVGRLDGHRRPDGAQRHADIGRRQRGSVVDAVTQH